MDRAGILHVLSRIRASNVLPYGSNVQCSCFLAPYRRGHTSKEDSKPSMGILVDEHGDSSVHCFACNFGGTLERAVSTLQRYSGRDCTEVIKEITLLEAGDPEWIANSIPDYDDSGPEELTEYPEQTLIEMRGLAHPYILKRGFDVQTLREWGIGYDRDKARVVVPVRKPSGSLVGMVGRAVGNYAKPKYTNYFEFSRGRCLLGAHLVRQDTTLIVTEGTLDGPALWQMLREEGMLTDYSVVSAMGSKTTKEQAKLVVQLANDVILFFDNDESGAEGVDLLGERLTSFGLGVRATVYPQGAPHDPTAMLEKKAGKLAATMVREAMLLGL